MPLLGGCIFFWLSLKTIHWKLSENGFHCIFNNKKNIYETTTGKMDLISYLKQSKNKQIFLKMWFFKTLGIRLDIKHEEIKHNQHWKMGNKQVLKLYQLTPLIAFLTNGKGTGKPVRAWQAWHVNFRSWSWENIETKTS